MYSYSLCFHNNQHYYSGEYTEYHIASTISHDYNFVIDNGASIHLTAGEEIVLTDGFYAASGADFVAKIEACEPDDGEETPNRGGGIGERNLLGGRTQDGRTRCVPTDGCLLPPRRYLPTARGDGERRGNRTVCEELRIRIQQLDAPSHSYRQAEMDFASFKGNRAVFLLPQRITEVEIARFCVKSHP